MLNNKIFSHFVAPPPPLVINARSLSSAPTFCAVRGRDEQVGPQIDFDGVKTSGGWGRW